VLLALIPGMSESLSPTSRAVERPVRCLLVDDEPPLLRGLCRILNQRRPEWEIQCADSGAAAIEALEALRFDCVMTDLQMPNMNGLTLLKLIQARFPYCVRLVHSSQIETVGRDQVKALCHRILPKPAPADEVISALEWAIRLARRLEQSGTG
jgi:YesN/AraC family two-component response regulator